MLRKYRGTRSKLCSKCHNVKEVASKRYCRKCAADYNREWLKKNPPTDIQYKKASARWKTNVYVNRGYIKKLPCRVCGTNEKVQAHHKDYDDFKNVEWLCMNCHKQHHKDELQKDWWKQIDLF